MTGTIKTSCLALAVCLAVLSACTGRSSDTPKAADLTGNYRIVSGERDGAPIDRNELTDAIIQISNQTITAYDKERKETFAATYTLETNRIPWQITMISTKAPEVGAIAKGLVEVDQNNVKLIYALPNGQPPMDFKAGERQQMFVLTKTDVALPADATAPAGT
jgi:uncharacterized protein (TIGR03067 family)